MKSTASAFIILFFILLAGCSGNGGNSVIPDENRPGLITDSKSIGTNHVLWGMWQCAYDFEQDNFITVPARTDQTHLNVTGNLNSSLGLSFSPIPGLTDPSAGKFAMSVELTHPFPGNMNLAGFDVRGIFIGKGSLKSGTLRFPGEDDPYMVNPDGYTRWWNPGEFPTPGLYGFTPGIYGSKPLIDALQAATINPYRQFADCLSQDFPVTNMIFYPSYNPESRGIFNPGKTNERRYQVNFPMVGGKPQAIFNYAVDASWAKSDIIPATGPWDFPLKANSDEACFVEASVVADSLWAIEGSDQSGGKLSLSIECYDWQGLFDDYSGQIGPLYLLSPFCEFETGIQPDVSVSPGGKATLTASVSGFPTKEGEIPVWVGVTAPGSSYKQGINPAPNVPVAAFTKITVVVAEPECQSNGNDDCGTAESISPVSETDGVLCLEGDVEDWFNFVIPPGGNGSGSIALETWGLSDLDLYLYKDCPGTQLYESANPGTADEEINVFNLGVGDYFIGVTAPDDGDVSLRPYHLSINIKGIGTDCTGDENNTPETADTVSLASDTDQTVCLVGDQKDWFTFEIAPGSIAYGSIRLNNKGFSNNDMYLYDDTLGTPLMIGNIGGIGDEKFDIDILLSGTYFIRVDAKGTYPEGDRPITLEMDLTEIVGSCDNSDGNNTASEADSMEPVDSKEETVCFPSDPDWYVFEIPLGGLEGTITLDSSNFYDNDLALYADPDEPPIEISAHSGNGNEIIDPGFLTEGSYYIKVTASVNPGGQDQEYILSTDFTPPIIKPNDTWLHVHIVETTQGTSPATDLATVVADADWADEFWGIWLDGSVQIASIDYIDNTAWLSLTSSEAETMFEEYGIQSGGLNVFYVNETPDMPGAAAYAWMDCKFEFQDHTTALVVISDYADSASLAHELGHAVGLLGDMYLLDYTDCDNITYCPYGNTDIFCLESDASLGNLMYWPVGEDVSSYWLSNTDFVMDTPDIDSQAENINYFRINYPNAFTKP